MRKNLTLISLMLGVMLLVSMTGLVSASTYGPAGPDSATCTTDSGGTYTCTSQLESEDFDYFDTSTYVAMEGEEEAQGTWDWVSSNIPANAIVQEVKVYVKGWEYDPNVDANIQLWSSNSDKSLTDYQPFPKYEWDTLVFQDPRLINEVQTRISSSENIKLEVDFEKGTSTGCHDNCEGVYIDYVWLEIEYTIPACEVIVDEPIEGEFYDPVLIKWHYEGDCEPFEYNLRYQEGSCSPVGTWLNIKEGIDPWANNSQVYIWPDGELPENGTYCIAANMDQHNANDVTGYSGLWYLDLAPPYANMSVGTPKVGECTEAEGNCYVNQDTKITLTCSDDNPDEEWQSEGPYTIKYKINDGSEQIYTVPFKFDADSEHDIEYWCYDEVGKESPHKTKDFFVNSEGPTIQKTVGEPKVEGSLGEYEGFDWYVTTNTKICFDTEKGNQEHPTPGEVTISCEVGWGSSPNCIPEHPITLDGDGCFNYYQDSFHSVRCVATDALGNSEELYEKDIVNSQAPTTTFGHEGPYYSEEGVQWIDTISTIGFTVEKGNQKHPTPGDVTTYYRYGTVDNEFCDGTNQEDWDGTYNEIEQEWTTYEGPFGLPESCHAIEYYSVDALGNTENANVEFVFSDHTAPELDLAVGESGINCNSIFSGWQCEDENWDWKVTMDTSVTISCEDQDPHPSGVNEICYTIYWDGSEEAPTTQCANENSVTLWFTESCEHRVEYNCTDNVGKSSSDSQVFKVDGNNFVIDLDMKWNLISVPVNLLSSSMEEVFGDDENIEEVWSYENGEWLYYAPGDSSSTLSTIVPGKGYWVKTSGSTDIVVGGSLFAEASTPNSVPIDSGWNLIGHYGVASKPRSCALASIFNEWSTLVGYDSTNNPPFDDAYYMNPGEGYWLFAQGDDSYAYSNQACWGYY